MKKGRLKEPITTLAMCPKCKVTKPRRDFYENPTSRTGYQYVCKECQKVAQKARYDEMKAARDQLRFQKTLKELDGDADK